MRRCASLQEQQRPQMQRSMSSSLLMLQHLTSASIAFSSLTLRMTPGAPVSNCSPAVLMQTRQAKQQQQASQLMAAATMI
jgi:hypothetical protein